MPTTTRFATGCGNSASFSATGRRIEEVRRIALDRAAPMDIRTSALRSLIDRRPDDLRAICESLLEENHINVVAARGLALFDDPAIGKALVKNYRRFRAPDRPQAISVLVSRPSFAGPLLDAVADGQVPREDLSAFHVRQIHSFGDEALSKRVTEVWGALRESPEEKRSLMASLRSPTDPGGARGGRPGSGTARLRPVVPRTATGSTARGRRSAPDLTGSGRHDLDYLLENVVDPSAVVNADYRMTVLLLTDGRVLNGLVTEQTERTVTLQALTEKLTVDRREIEESQVTDLSPMPEGQLETLSEDQVRDLIAYLKHPGQVARPEPAD